MKRLSAISLMLFLILALASCEEPVLEIKVSAITLNSESLSMTEGDTFKLNATVSPDNATDKTVIWTSSDAGIVSVDDGAVTAVKPGSATITVASKDGGAKATCPVIVTARNIPVESVTLNQQEATMTPGQTLALTATVKPDNATDKDVVWTSNNSSVATVKDGTVTAVGLGAASITATAGGKNASCTITVKEAYIEVTSVTLNQTSFTVLEGETFYLKATVKPDDATDKTVTWESSDETILTVYGGTVKTLKAGTATVTATAGGKSATCEVLVTARIPVESVTLDYNKLTLLIGESATLTATVEPEDATNKTVKWSSDDTDIVTVKSGTVKAIGVGTAIITATAGEKTATCTVTVKPIEVESITLNKAFLTLNPGESEQLKVTFNPSNATDKTVTWTTGNSAIATVDADGTVNALAKGSTTITAKSGKATATCEVKVNDNYLTISNLTNYDGIVTLKPSSVTAPTITLEYSDDNGNTWVKLSNFKTLQELPLPANGTLMLAGNNQTFCSTSSSKGWWTITANVTHNVSGDLMTISGDSDALASKYEFYRLFSDDTKLKSAHFLHLTAEKLSDFCYAQMFKGCTNLEQAPEMLATQLAASCYKGMFEDCKTLTRLPELPATTMQPYCYEEMFKGCTALTEAPALPATTLANYCYQSMFESCSALTKAPELPAVSLYNARSCYSSMFRYCKALSQSPQLPAKVLSEGCYTAMFYDCQNLEVAPELPATTMRRMCYYMMFANCTKLAKAPELPAKTLAQQCYTSMFSNCFALTEAPVLPAEKLVANCYEKMFTYCSGINRVTCLATDIAAPGCTLDWLANVATAGTFIKAPTMESWPSGTSGIPNNWEVEDYEEEEPEE